MFVECICGRSGQPASIPGIIHGVTKGKEMKQTDAETAKLIESIINLSPDIIYIFDIKEKKNIYSNEGISRVLGY